MSERTGHAEEGASARSGAPDDADLRYEEALAEVDRMRDELLRIREILAASAQSEAAVPPHRGTDKAPAPVRPDPPRVVDVLDPDRRGADVVVRPSIPHASRAREPVPGTRWKGPAVVAGGLLLAAGAALGVGVATRSPGDAASLGRAASADAAQTDPGDGVEGAKDGDGSEGAPGRGTDGSSRGRSPSPTESFTSPEGGYSLRYPARWDLDARGEVTVLTSPDGAESVSFALGPSDLTSSLDSFAALVRATYPEVGLTSQRDTSVAGARAIEVAGRATSRDGVRLRFEALLVERAGSRSIGVFAARRGGGAPSAAALEVMRSLRLASP